MVLAIIDRITTSDGRVFTPGVRVRHIDTKLEGTVTSITVPESGVGAPRIRIDPDDLDAVARYGMNWAIAQQPGCDETCDFHCVHRHRIEWRDAGLTLRNWEICDEQEPQT